MKRTVVLVVFSLFAAALLATAVIAVKLTQTAALAPDSEPVSEHSSGRGLSRGESAMRATINPETGRVDVSSVPMGMALDAETLEALRRDSEGLKQTFHPNGAVSVDLRGRFQSVSVARIGVNGKVVICTEDADHVNGIIEGRAVEGPAEGRVPEVR